jgi:hypothetical protein
VLPARFVQRRNRRLFVGQHACATRELIPFLLQRRGRVGLDDLNEHAALLSFNLGRASALGYGVTSP